jgi:hypothetical protein
MSVKKAELARKLAKVVAQAHRKMTPEGDTFPKALAKKFAKSVKAGVEQFHAEMEMSADEQRHALRVEAIRASSQIGARKVQAPLAHGPMVKDPSRMRLPAVRWVQSENKTRTWRESIIATANQAFAEEVLMEQKEIVKRESILTKLEAELWSRGRYEKVSIFTFREKRNKDKTLTGEAWWRFVEELRAPGMIDLYMQAEGKAKPTEQNWFHCENQLPKDAGSAFPRRFDIPKEAWAPFAENEHVLLCSKTVAWSRKTGAFNIVKGMFPSATDFRAYSASLTSPVLPNSFAKYKVVVKELLNADGTAPMGVDGSGRAHPSIWGEFSRQVRIMGAGHWRRVFGKGVITPDERCVDANGNPEIWLDIGQIKGAKKDDLKEILKKCASFSMEVYIGCISEWRNSKTTKLSFEQIQQFAETPRTKALLRKWLLKAYAQALKNGPEALLTQAIEDEENLQLQRKLASLMKVHGTQKCISGLQMSHLRNLMQGRLEKSLYFFAQGAGKMGMQMVCVMDNDVAPGTIVYRNAPVGTQVVVYRFPTLLPQGVRALTCVEPLNHHKVNGKVVFATAYMNPLDLVDCMQGDDDGDIIGIIDDQDLVECMKDKLATNSTIALIESQPVSKRNAQMDTPEGEKFVMEPVSKMEIGTYTNHQAGRYATGDMAGVFALAPCIQDATDAPKKVLTYTNPYKAVGRNDWVVHPRGAPYRYCPGSKDPKVKSHSKLVKQFVLDRMEAEGLVITEEDGTRYPAINVTPWKKTSKRINAEEFAPLRVEGEFQGNIVWYCHDEAARIWIEGYKTQYTLSDMPEINWKLQADSLAELLAKRNQFVPHERMSWLDYQKALRTPKGLADYGRALQEASTMGKEESLAHINRAQEKLMLKLQDLTIHELESIWYHEMYYSDEGGNVNHPWTALCHPGSQLMQVLGLTPESCDHMNERRLEHVMEIVKETQHPHRALVEIVRTDNSHSNALHTNLWECKCCMKRLSDAFVKHYRSEQTEKSNLLPKHMVSNVLCGSWKFSDKE